jgi:AcrR family transcriptional regulator
MDRVTKTRPGRPLVLSLEERRNRIMDAAECIFMETGYGAASMNEIARKSGMSKKTLYQIFPDKLSIFVALVLNYDVCSSYSTKTIAGTGDLYAEIREVLLEFARFVLSPRQVALTRLVIAESKHSPELAQGFYENCLNGGIQVISNRMEKMRGAFLQKGYDVDMVADILLSAALSALHMRTLVCNLDPDIVRREAEARIEATLKLIMGYFS